MKVDGQKMIGRIMNGLKPKIRADLIRHNPTTMKELRTQASLAELAHSLESETTAVQNTTNATLSNAVSSLEERIQDVETNNMNMVNMVYKPHFINHGPRPNHRSPRHSTVYHQMPAQYPPSQPPQMQHAQYPAMQPAQYQQRSRPMFNNQLQNQHSSGSCHRCGESCDSVYNCRARNENCLNCKKPNHLWMCCRRLTNDLKMGKVSQADIQNWVKQTNNSA